MINLQCCVGGYQIHINSTNHFQTTQAQLKAVSLTYVRLKEIREWNYLQYVKEFTSDILKAFVKAACLSAAMFCLFHLLCNSNGVRFPSCPLQLFGTCKALWRFFGISCKPRGWCKLLCFVASNCSWNWIQAQIKSIWVRAALGLTQKCTSLK